MREILIPVLCVCSVSGFRIFPVRSVEIINEDDAVAETLVITNQSTTIPPLPIETSELSTDLTSTSLSNTITETSRSFDTAVGIKSDINSSPWSISTFVNAVDSRPDKIAPSSKGLLGISTGSEVTPLTIPLSESPSISNGTLKSSVNASSTITEKSKFSSEATETSSSRSDTTLTNLKDSEATEPISLSESVTTESELVSTSTTAEELTSLSEAPATSLSESTVATSNILKDSEPTTSLTSTEPVSEQSGLITTDSLKSKPSVLNALNSIKNESSSTMPELVSGSASSESSLTGSEELTTESIISLETTTQDLSFLSVDLLPPKTEYRKNKPDPRYDY